MRFIQLVELVGFEKLFPIRSDVEATSITTPTTTTVQLLTVHQQMMRRYDFVMACNISDQTHHVVVVAGGGDLFEDGGDAKEEDVEEDVEEVAEGEAEHQLVEVLLDQLPRKPNDSRRVANNSKHPDNKLKRGVDDSHN